jgi:hypothetical protein
MFQAFGATPRNKMHLLIMLAMSTYREENIESTRGEQNTRFRETRFLVNDRIGECSAMLAFPAKLFLIPKLCDVDDLLSSLGSESLSNEVFFFAALELLS